MIPDEDVCWSFVWKWKGNNKIFKCFQTTKASANVSVWPVKFLQQDESQHSGSFVIRCDVKCQQCLGQGRGCV